MTLLNTKSGLELAATPIIITDKNGLVVYKNECAMRKFKNPMRRKSILKYISDDASRIFSEVEQNGGALAVLTVNRIFRYAAVLPCKFDSADCVAWIFPPYLQLNLSTSFRSKFAEAIPTFRLIFDELFQPFENPPNSYALDTRTEKLRDYYEKMFSLLFSEEDGIGNGKKYDLFNTLNIIRSKAGGLFAKYGYRISVSGNVFFDPPIYIFDMKNYVVLLFQTLLFAFSLSDNKTISLEFFADQHKISALVTLKLSSFAAKHDGNSDSFDISELLPFSPAEYMNLKMYQTICANPDFSFRCFSYPDGSVCIRFHAPVTSPKLSLGSGISDDILEIENFIELITEIF